MEPARQDGQVGRFAGKKILVVDDNEYVCEMISKVLEKYLDLEVCKIKSGSQVIAAALTGRYDGAIIDLNLQSISASKIIRTIKTMLPSFPVLTMSAHSSEEQLAALNKRGINRVIHKPFKMTTLIDEITEILGVEKSVPAQRQT
jgi:DNA-binding response OmpR family regulator